MSYKNFYGTKELIVLQYLVWGNTYSQEGLFIDTWNSYITSPDDS